MRATLLLRERVVLADTLFAELVVWRVPVPLRGSGHPFKYRLALVSEGACVLRYDNEAGKGDHRHLAGKQVPYVFRGIEQLEKDFLADVAAWRDGRCER